VGKTYLCCSGLEWVENTFPQDVRIIHQTKRIYNLAEDMMNFIETYKKVSLKLKIGVHCG
jgi:Adenylate and Guanylate cyclase catalytic domain